MRVDMLTSMHPTRRDSYSGVFIIRRIGTMRERIWFDAYAVVRQETKIANL